MNTLIDFCTNPWAIAIAAIVNIGVVLARLL